MRILFIEDDPTLLSEVATRLKKEGYAVDVAADGEEGLHYATEYPLDLAIVDLGLPKLSGLEVIRKTRSQGKKFPILILTAHNRWQEKVEGLEAGADDYVVKPFQMEELFARMRALLRRSAGWAQGILTCGPVSLDPAGQAVTVRGKSIELTAFEYKVLEYLMLHAGRVVSKTDLTEHIYSEDSERDSNVLEVLIGRLRKKLDPDEKIHPIETLRGRGYRFTLERTPAP
ncbi:MAG: response regulator transcription factor [Pseudomonadota bacterium]